MEEEFFDLHSMFICRITFLKAKLSLQQPFAEFVANLQANYIHPPSGQYRYTMTQDKRKYNSHIGRNIWSAGFMDFIMGASPVPTATVP